MIIPVVSADVTCSISSGVSYALTLTMIIMTKTIRMIMPLIVMMIPHRDQKLPPSLRDSLSIRFAFIGHFIISSSLLFRTHSDIGDLVDLARESTFFPSACCSSLAGRNVLSVFLGSSPIRGTPLAWESSILTSRSGRDTRMINSYALQLLNGLSDQI